MKGDIIVLERHHIEVGKKIVNSIKELIEAKASRYIITVAGESGSGKSETGKAIADSLAEYNIEAVLLGQDDFFVLPPKANDTARRSDASWLGPHVEVEMNLLNSLILKAIEGEGNLICPQIDYDQDTIEQQVVELTGVKVVILEGTYTSLLRHVDTKVFIDKNRLETLEHRQKRNRGNEVGDPFIEGILEMEHKIIAGHRYLADFIISKDNQLSRQI